MSKHNVHKKQSKPNLALPAGSKLESAAFSPDNPGDEVFNAKFSAVSSVSDSRAWLADYTDGTITESMMGTNQLSITAVDPDLAQLRAGNFDDKYELDIDGVPFRISTVDLIDTDLVRLVFEHRIIAKMREHTDPLKATRDAMTRAQFIYEMTKEIGDEAIEFIAPELTKKQPIAAAKTPKHPKQATAVPGKAPGFAPGVHLTVKGNGASDAQKAIAATCLGVAVSLGCSSKVMVGMVETLIVENEMSNTRGGGKDAISFGVFQDTTGGTGPVGYRGDVAKEAHLFLMGGPAFQAGGLVACVKNNPGLPAGTCAQKVQVSAYPSRYNERQKEAEAWVKAFTGSAVAYSGDPGVGGGAQTYEFYRGTPGQPEDSWTCGLRLASEVQWRLFVAGRKSLYYVADRDLMTQEPRYLIDRQTPGVHGLTFTVEKGKRYVIVKGNRIAKPSEAILTVRTDRWDAPPGTVIELADYGPENGRWLINEVVRPLFDAETTIHLHQPEDPTDEPPASAGTSVDNKTSTGRVYGRAGSGGSAGAGKGGSGGDLLGTLGSGDKFQWRRYDQGQDVEITPAGNPIYAAGSGTAHIAHDPGGGGGHFGPNYVWVQYSTGPFAGKAVYYGHCPAVIGDNAHVSKGTVLAHTGTAADRAANRNGGVSTLGWLEIGFWPPGSMGVGIQMSHKLGNPSPSPT